MTRQKERPGGRVVRANGVAVDSGISRRHLRDSRRETSGAGRLAVLNHHRNPNRLMKEITIKIRIKNFRSPIMMHQRTDLTVVKRANFLHLIGG
jgi:hypothetical protein